MIRAMSLGGIAPVAACCCKPTRLHFPFMAPDLRLRTPNRLCADTLHEGVVWPTNQRLFYIGMQDQW